MRHFEAHDFLVRSDRYLCAPGIFETAFSFCPIGLSDSFIYVLTIRTAPPLPKRPTPAASLQTVSSTYQTWRRGCCRGLDTDKNKNENNHNNNSFEYQQGQGTESFSRGTEHLQGEREKEAEIKKNEQDKCMPWWRESAGSLTRRKKRGK